MGLRQTATALCLLLGCRPGPVEDTGDGGGSSGDGGTGTTTPDDGGDAGGETGGTGETATGCGQYLDDPNIGPTVRVTIRNASHETIFVPEVLGCDAVAPFELYQDDTAVHWWPRGCIFTCERIMAEGPLACPASCPVDSVIGIAPGASIVREWPGVTIRTTSVPMDCAPKGGGQCYVRHQAPSATYGLRLHGGTAIDCAGSPAPCECTMDDGLCSAPGAVGGSPRTATTTIAFPGETRVELAFETGA